MQMNAPQQMVITVMIMQFVRIQLDHLHVLVILDLMGMVLIVQVSFIHIHVFYNFTSIFVIHIQ